MLPSPTQSMQTSYRSYLTVQMSDLCKQWLLEAQLTAEDKSAYFQVRESIKSCKEFDRKPNKWKGDETAADRVQVAKDVKLIQVRQGLMLHGLCHSALISEACNCCSDLSWPRG